MITILASSALAQVAWTDWTTINAGVGVDGFIDVDGTIVNVTYTGEYSFAQVSGGTNYWVPDAYTNATVPNAPPTPDIIALHFATAKTLTFSQPVTNPIFAVVSLNGNGYQFDRDFDIAGFGPGFWGNGTLTKQITDHGGGVITYDLIGSGEPHGTIQFIGTFSTLNWTSLSNENWNGFTIGVENLAAAVPPEIQVFDGPTTGDPERFDDQASPFDFGTVAGDDTQTFTILNSGTGPLNFTASDLTGPDASAFSVSGVPLAIAAGNTATFDVTFSPGAAGPHDAVLTLNSDDADEGAFEINLAGTGDDCDSLCQAMPFIVDNANNAIGFTALRQDHPTARLRPTRVESFLRELMNTLADQGCTVQPVVQEYVSGSYNLGNSTFLAHSSDGPGPLPGTFDTPTHTFVGDLGPNLFGDTFSLYREYDGRFVSNREDGGFVAGRWLRVSGKKGVGVGLHGVCDGSTAAPDALQGWFGSDLSGW